jgi:TM2 domain-containing membrane protein YozV
MDSKKVEFIISLCNDKFKPIHLAEIQKQLEQADDSKYAIIQSINYKDPSIALVISIIAGGWGVDRFYLEDIPLGILKLITFGGLGIWWVYDIFFVADKVREWNYTQFQKALNGYTIY